MYYTYHNRLVTDTKQSMYDCLAYDVIEYGEPYYRSKIIVIRELILYCFRSLKQPEYASLYFSNIRGKNFTFAQLKVKQVTSDQLYSWSAPIDIIEEYEVYLSTNDSSMDIIFYNCTYPWFGPLCQYSWLPYQYFESFTDVVLSTFHGGLRETYGKLPPWMILTNLSCYAYLPCNRGGSYPACLDWREICDGKIDCIDGGIDEKYCDQLEANECEDNEYRCHNGQCIPEDFLRDNMYNPDCLDATDEPVSEYYPTRCTYDPTFRCENIKCRPSSKENLDCGDGQCAYTTCQNKRHILLMVAMYEPTQHISEECRDAMFCLTRIDDCVPKPKINKLCPHHFQFPEVPVLFGHVKLFYSNDQSNFNSTKYMLPKYVCHDPRLCPFYTTDEDKIRLSCQHTDTLLPQLHKASTWASLIFELKKLFRICSVTPDGYCRHNQTLYQCNSSLKCISKHRLIDGIQDCFLNDDEQYSNSCSLNKSKYRLSCDDKCLSPIMVGNKHGDCTDSEDERWSDSKRSDRNIFFQTICDGFIELDPPLFINGEYYTDETECDLWLCNNTYTRCDGIWNCIKGEDEVNCPPSSCPPLEHICVSPVNNSLFCLPIENAGNGIVDCLGASDERQLCRIWDPYLEDTRFWCRNDTKCVSDTVLCDNKLDCAHGDDEQFCSLAKHKCSYSDKTVSVQTFLCSLHDVRKQTFIPFSLGDSYVGSQKPPTADINSTSSSIKQRLVKQEKNESVSDAKRLEWIWFCNRGIAIVVRREVDNYTTKCLCPPSYYGDFCEYQNQRVSITIQVSASFNWHTVFAIVLTLIDDDEHLINAYYQYDYLPAFGCGTKSNIHLLYAARPKNISKNYSVRIDAFIRHSLEYHASWLFPIQFPFLPIHRMALQIIIPIKPMKSCSLDCGIHGQCLKYHNKENNFCRCNYGWSGLKCDNQDMCHCSPGSHCIGPSICLCAVNKFGPRCYLNGQLCSPNPCMNNGVCISPRETITRGSVHCICPDGFFGETCEFQNTQIDMIFHDMIMPSFIFIHFIEVNNFDDSRRRTTTIKKIGLYENSLTIYRTFRFHIIFAEVNKNYYLIFIQKEYVSSLNISSDVTPSHRCLSINELFNATFVELHLIRRIKYYHLPCQQRVDLVCFYDSTQICLCNPHQQANCFQFDHNMTYQCRDRTYCENSVQCFQNDIHCPTMAGCLCLECYYGSRCQFSTKGISLSLDIILGYHIRPKIKLSKQPLVTKVCTAVTIVITIVGLFNCFLTIITFRRKLVHDTGCRIYLLASSVSSLFTIIFFTLKFWLLLFAQMNTIVNRSVLYFNCKSIDYLLQVFVTMTDWLNACVGVERTVAVSKGITFDKLKSKQATKWVITSIALFITSSLIPDPVHRSLFDDEEERRTWCLTKYSPSFQRINSVVIYVRFFIPFAVNIISALIIILMTARHRSNAQKKLSYEQHLRQQFQQHKHLLISSGILFILALPRLIILSLSTCMKSTRAPWLFLFGYFVSCIPSTLSFVVFILPSDIYKKELRKAIKRIRQKFRRT